MDPGATPDGGDGGDMVADVFLARFPDDLGHQLEDPDVLEMRPVEDDDVPHGGGMGAVLERALESLGLRKYPLSHIFNKSHIATRRTG